MSGSCRVAAGGIEVQEEHIRHSLRRCLEIKSELGKEGSASSQPIRENLSLESFKQQARRLCV